ncbi:MAG TPA: transglutaminase family protein [Chitinispirillaceae bacterium]|nr:transglutaminase family protein [Chitinispirillaceae bacterium]
MKKTVMFLFAFFLAAGCPLAKQDSFAVSDTMDLLLEGLSAGDLRSYLSVRSDSVEFRSELITRHVNQSGEAVQANRISERRRFGPDGSLVEAFQEVSSPAGKNFWTLRRNSSGEWELTVNAGGTGSKRIVKSVNENCNSTIQIYRGIFGSSIKPGDTWVDTAFELISGQHIHTRTTCRQVPSEKNGFRFVFDTRSSLYDRNEVWEVDRNGHTLLREVYPFVAKRKGESGKEYRTADLFEALCIKKERLKASERVVLVIDPDILHPSVKSFYTGNGDRFTLLDQPRKCTGKVVAVSDSLKKYTVPTPTMQVTHEKIVSHANSLRGDAANSCELVGRYNRYVFEKLDKKNTATFSSALETLNAGFGDCGEHAVLLAALLRASGIPARVVLGMVYVGRKSGYYYHAWVMAFTGEWVFADPAFGIFPAATERIPLIIDDTGESSVDIVKLIGRLKIEHVKGKQG